MDTVITNFEPLGEHIVATAHPDAPGEQIRFTVYQRVAVTSFGTYVSRDISGSAAGSMSGRALAPGSWTPEMKRAFEELRRTAVLRKPGFTMSTAGYFLVALAVAALGAIAWGIGGALLAKAEGETYDHAHARVESLAAAPAVGDALLVAEPNGAAFRWHIIRGIDDEDVELAASSESIDMSFEVVDPSEMSFEGLQLIVPRQGFLKHASLGGTPVPRGVVNASP